MASLADVDDLAVVHLRTAVPVCHCQVRETAEDIKPCDQAAVFLDYRYIRLNLCHQFVIYLDLKGIYTLFGTEDLLFVFLELFGYISFRID